MKSAFELAMERLGGTVKQYTPEQKEALADIDREYNAKIAQVKLTGGPKEGETLEERQQREDGVVSELRRLEEKRESRKEELRRKFDAC